MEHKTDNEIKNGFFTKPPVFNKPPFDLTPEEDEVQREIGIKWLKNHFRYFTMNSWNRSTSYANNVKLTNLGLTSEEMNKAFDILEALCDPDCDTFEYEINQSMLFQEFYEKTGHCAGWNGRSSGYIVLYDTKWDETQKKSVAMPGKSMDDDFEDFEDFETSQIRDRIELVTEFDTLCDKLRDLLLDYIHNSKITSDTIMVEKTVRTLSISE